MRLLSLPSLFFCVSFCFFSFAENFTPKPLYPGSREWQFPQTSQTVVIGDLQNLGHTDLTEAFQHYKLINEKGKWIGGNTQVVLMGNFLIGDQWEEKLRELQNLRSSAESKGGKIHTLIGDKEIEQWLTYGNYPTFKYDPRSEKKEAIHELYQELAKSNALLKVGSTVFKANSTIRKNGKIFPATDLSQLDSLTKAELLQVNSTFENFVQLMEEAVNETSVSARQVKSNPLVADYLKFHYGYDPDAPNPSPAKTNPVVQSMNPDQLKIFNKSRLFRFLTADDKKKPSLGGGLEPHHGFRLSEELLLKLKKGGISLPPEGIDHFQLARLLFIQNFNQPDSSYTELLVTELLAELEKKHPTKQLIKTPVDKLAATGEHIDSSRKPVAGDKLDETGDFAPLEKSVDKLGTTGEHIPESVSNPGATADFVLNNSDGPDSKGKDKNKWNDSQGKAPGTFNFIAFDHPLISQGYSEDFELLDGTTKPVTERAILKNLGADQMITSNGMVGAIGSGTIRNLAPPLGKSLREGEALSAVLTRLKPFYEQIDHFRAKPQQFNLEAYRSGQSGDVESFENDLKFAGAGRSQNRRLLCMKALKLLAIPAGIGATVWGGMRVRNAFVKKPEIQIPGTPLPEACANAGGVYVEKIHACFCESTKKMMNPFKEICN